MKSSMNEAQFELTQKQSSAIRLFDHCDAIEITTNNFLSGTGTYMCYLQGSTQLYSSHIRHYIGPEVWSVKQ